MVDRVRLQALQARVKAEILVFVKVSVALNRVGLGSLIEVLNLRLRGC